MNKDTDYQLIHDIDFIVDEMNKKLTQEERDEILHPTLENIEGYSFPSDYIVSGETGKNKGEIGPSYFVPHKPSDFTTLDSGEREEFETGMQRNSQKNKPRYDLVVPLTMKHNLLDRWAELMARGAKVYGSRNWEAASTQEELDRFRASAFRHFIQWFKGEDKEDHAAAVLFNIQGAEYVKEKMGGK